jgi:hypothetical protein
VKSCVYVAEEIVERALFEASIRFERLFDTYPIFALRWQLAALLIFGIPGVDWQVLHWRGPEVDLHVLMEKKRMMEPNRAESDGWGGLYLCRMNQ